MEPPENSPGDFQRKSWAAEERMLWPQQWDPRNPVTHTRRPARVPRSCKWHHRPAGRDQGFVNRGQTLHVRPPNVPELCRTGGAPSLRLDIPLRSHTPSPMASDARGLQESSGPRERHGGPGVMGRENTGQAPCLWVPRGFREPRPQRYLC